MIVPGGIEKKINLFPRFAIATASSQRGLVWRGELEQQGTKLYSTNQFSFQQIFSASCLPGPDPSNSSVLWDFFSVLFTLSTEKLDLNVK